MVFTNVIFFPYVLHPDLSMKKYAFKNLDPKHLYLKEGGEEEEGRKLWVKVKDTDDIIEINLDKVSTTRCGSGFN